MTGPIRFPHDDRARNPAQGILGRSGKARTSRGACPDRRFAEARRALLQGEKPPPAPGGGHRRAISR